jgi:hypothetical protein
VTIAKLPGNADFKLLFGNHVLYLPTLNWLIP